MKKINCLALTIAALTMLCATFARAQYEPDLTPGGTTGQIQINSSGVLAGTSSLPNGTTATTQAANDNSTNVATTAYVNNLISIATGTLSSAQLAAINTTPVTAIAAPGAGKYIQILGVSAKYVYGGTAYTGSNPLLLEYSGGGGVTNSVFSSAIMTGTASAWSTAVGSPSSAVSGSTSGIDNTAVVFTAAGNYATGTGTVDYTITYTIVND